MRTLLSLRLRPAATSLAALLLLGLTSYFLLQGISAERLTSLRYPAESAGRMVERHMEFYEGYHDVPRSVQRLHTALFGSRDHVQAEAVRVYREVLGYLATHPNEATPWAVLNTRVRLIVTLAEAGRRTEALSELGRLDANPEEMTIAAAIRYAYGFGGANASSAEIWSGVGLLPLGWAADRLQVRAAERSANQSVLETSHRRLFANGSRWRSRTLLLVVVVATLLGAGALLWYTDVVAQPVAPWRSAVLEAPWDLQQGLAVLVCAALAGVLILLALGLIPHPFFRPGILDLWSTLFASLPMLWLIRTSLLRPRGLSFARAFGLCSPQGGTPMVLRITLIVLALEWAGTLLIAWVAWRLGLQAHWSEGLYEQMIFGPWQTTALGVVGMVIWVPVFEELGFRGLLYVTLRSRFGPVAAAALSAALFSALHPYSVPGFFSLFWSALVLTWAFERFRSLLPGMIVHAAGNLLALSPVLLFYR